jgi:hypothetical protein
MKKILGITILAVILWSCGKDDEDKCAFAPDVSDVSLEVTFERFEDSLTNIRSKPELVNFLTRHPLIRIHAFNRAEFPNDSVFVNEIYNRLTNPHLDTLALETKKVFGDGSQLKEEFTQAFTHLKYYYPDFTPPKIQTVITGLMGNDLFVSDSVIIVSLDYYLGPGARYRPRVYDYILRQYKKENIVPSCMMIYGISDRYNKTNLGDKTVLADMIAYGKSFYFAKHMQPCVPDSVFIWYTPKELQGSRRSQDLIWARLIQDDVLYSTSHLMKQKYLGERPKTIDVGPECPGRIAQWVGWQIVNSYMDSHEDISLPELMSKDNARRLLEESNYTSRFSNR